MNCAGGSLLEDLRLRDGRNGLTATIENGADGIPPAPLTSESVLLRSVRLNRSHADFGGVHFLVRSELGRAQVACGSVAALPNRPQDAPAAAHSIRALPRAAPSTLSEHRSR